MYYTRQQLIDKGLLNTKPYSVTKEAFEALHNDILDSVHIPHSDVYFVRSALEKRSGYYLPLNEVEAAMKKEGWRDRKKKW
jgi:hypothetical protein